MPNIIEQKKHFSKLRSILEHECRNGQIHYRIWKVLHDTDQINHKILEISPEFFSKTIRAHFYTAISHLARLLRKDKDADNIFSFINYIKTNIKIFLPKYNNTILESIEKDQNALNSSHECYLFIKLRDDYLAHLSKHCKNDWDYLVKTYKITPDDIKNLFDQVSEIINRYSNYFDGRTYSFRSTRSGDVCYLLDKIS